MNIYLTIMISVIIFLYLFYKFYLIINYKFWANQPVFHKINLLYYILPNNIINTDLPKISRYCNFKDIKVNDVCIYAEGDKNLVGTPKVKAGDIDIDKHGKPVLDEDGNQIVRKRDSTSWDSFSYAIQMGHNVWSHINAVQEANRQYDNGILPNMLVQEQFDRVLFRDVVDEIFATDDRDKANALIEKHSKFWMEIIGTRGAIGKKTVNASTGFANFFEEV